MSITASASASCTRVPGGSPVPIFFFQAEDGIRDVAVTGVQTCALPICLLPIREPRRWQIVRAPIFFVRMHRTFRMVGSIFQALHPCGFERLVCFRQLFYAFVICV